MNQLLSSNHPPLQTVRQRSLIGPLLFLTYINDISDHMLCKTRLFANASIWLNWLVSCIPQTVELCYLQIDILITTLE